MSTSRKVLIPVDGSDNSQKAFDFYIDNLVHPEDTVLILHAHQTPHLSNFSLQEPLKLPTAEWSKKIQESIEKTQKLSAHYEMLCEAKKIAKKPLLKEGKPGEVICETAKSEGASMIVMGSRGLNTIRRTFVGSVSDYVLHHTSIPVTVVPS